MFESKMHKINFHNCLSRAEMLSLVLYTGCDCNYDLCSSQRDGDYKKWAIFDWCLYNAILKLHKIECYDNVTKKYQMKLYSGLKNVQLKENKLFISYFPTYVSTTYVKNISLQFASNNGMLIEMSEKVLDKFLCCSVEWISKFPDEFEVLIARSKNRETNAASMEITGLQTRNLQSKPGVNLNKNVQIVRLNPLQFDEKHRNAKIKLNNTSRDSNIFTKSQVERWNYIFKNCFTFKNMSPWMYSVFPHTNGTRKCHFGASLLYHDKMFQYYLKQFDIDNENNDSFNLQNNDIIKMQQGSEILKLLFNVNVFTSDDNKIGREMVKFFRKIARDHARYHARKDIVLIEFIQQRKWQSVSNILAQTTTY